MEAEEERRKRRKEQNKHAAQSFRRNKKFRESTLAELFQEKMAVFPVDGGLSEAMDAVSVTSGDLDILSYKMDASPRGICVVFNNKLFHTDDAYSVSSDDEPMQERQGTDVDRARLKATFERLHFTVEVFEDQTDAEIREVIKRLSERDHSRYDCFVCCVLSHGDRGVVYGSNGGAVRVRELMKPFLPDRCPTLAGKPKLFFLQACQGVRDHRGYGYSDLQRDNTPSDVRLIPIESDFLMSYATMLGYASWRHRDTGSWYIEQLTELLDKHADGHDISEILRAVNWKVGEKTADIPGEGQFKQAPVYVDGLRKKLIFKRNDSRARAPVMVFDPLTATPRRVFGVNTSQLTVQGDEEKPYLTSLVVTEWGRVVMADCYNMKVKVMDSRSPDSVSALSLGVKP